MALSRLVGVRRDGQLRRARVYLGEALLLTLAWRLASA
jgi:hypothetical protein